MALTRIHKGEGAPKANTNGGIKQNLHSITPGKSGHPVGGKGTKLGGKAY